MEKLLCGVDLGGTKLAAGLMRPDGKLIDREVVYDHAGKDEQEVVRRIGDTVTALLSRQAVKVGDLAGIGVGFAKVSPSHRPTTRDSRSRTSPFAAPSRRSSPHESSSTTTPTPRGSRNTATARVPDTDRWSS